MVVQNVNKRYYVYSHFREDKQEYFYIGLGSKTLKNKYTCKSRVYTRAYAKTSRNPHWLNIIKNSKYIVDIIEEFVDLKEAQKREQELILFYGRRDLGKGTLVNMSNGGEGQWGFVPSENHRQKSRERMKVMVEKRRIGEIKIVSGVAYEVLDLNTGVFYDSVTELSKYVKYSRTTLNTKFKENPQYKTYLRLDKGIIK